MNSQENFYDVIVVGAGPGGSAAAEKCAKYGLKTLLIEKEKLPRDKPCGGMCIDYLKELIELYGSEINDIVERRTDKLKVYLDQKIIFSKDYSIDLFLRKKLDYFITKRAIKSGAKLIENCRVTDIVVGKNKVHVFTEKGIFISKIIIGADGVNSIVAKKTGLNKGWGKNDVLLAMESEIKMSNREIEKRFGNCTIVYTYSNFLGYEWVIPKNNCVNIGLGTSVSKSGNLKEQFVNLAKQLDIKMKPTDIKAHLIPLRLLKKTYKERVLLCGDAGGFVYPLTGGGIETAIKSGRAAADICNEAIENDDFSLKRFKKYELYCSYFVKGIKKSRLQLSILEFCMKYKLINRYLVDKFFKYIIK